MENYWLFKADPKEWSWEQQLAKGRDGEEWSGVRNYLARNHMRLMKKGEKGFFYHSQKDPAIVGIVEIIKEAHKDSTSLDPKWQSVDIAALCTLPQKVSLAKVKTNPKLQNIQLVTNSRLSVQKLLWPEWLEICQMAGLTSAQITAL